MKEVTQTYYVCQYCGYTDSDDAAMRRHESLCQRKQPVEKLLGKWVKMDDSCYFRIMDCKPLSFTVRGVRITDYSVESYICRYKDVVNKPVVDKDYLKIWEKWKKAVEDE